MLLCFVFWPHVGWIGSSCDRIAFCWIATVAVDMDLDAMDVGPVAVDTDLDVVDVAFVIKNL